MAAYPIIGVVTYMQETKIAGHDNLEETEHSHVFWEKNESAGAQREKADIVNFGKKLADRLDVTVITKAGQWRPHEVSYNVIGESEDTDRPVVVVDFYTVSPGYGYLGEIEEEIAEIIND